MNVDYKLIGSRIKSARKRLGLTQETMAEYLDVTTGYISQVERGTTKISLDLLGKISVILDCDVSSLIHNSAIERSTYMVDDITELSRQLSARDRGVILLVIQSMLQDEKNR